MPIDNNVSEREMKRVVLNRKNSLFVGNPRGGRTAAILASLASTCRRHQVDPQLYFTQLLLNLPPLLRQLPHRQLREPHGSLDHLAPRPVETGASCPIHRSGNPRSSHHALAPALHVSLTINRR